VGFPIGYSKSLEVECVLTFFDKTYSTSNFSNYFKMTLKNTLLFIFCLPLTLMAQQNAEQPAFTKAKLLPGEAIETFNLIERKTIKRVFFIDEWSEGNFLFSTNQQTRRTFPLKYDVLNQELNVDMAGSIYLVPLDSIYGFTLENLLSLKDYEFTVRKSGKGKSAEIFEVLVDGQYQLLVKHVAEKLQADYQPALDTGSRDERIVKKEYRYFIDNEGRLLEIPKKKKSAEELFSNYPSAKQYLAKNKVNFKNKENLKGLILFMNNN
jgi:hypothetical protein